MADDAPSPPPEDASPEKNQRDASSGRTAARIRRIRAGPDEGRRLFKHHHPHALAACERIVAAAEAASQSGDADRALKTVLTAELSLASMSVLMANRSRSKCVKLSLVLTALVSLASAVSWPALSVAAAFLLGLGGLGFILFPLAMGFLYLMGRLVLGDIGLVGAAAAFLGIYGAALLATAAALEVFSWVSSLRAALARRRGHLLDAARLQERASIAPPGPRAIRRASGAWDAARREPARVLGRQPGGVTSVAFGPSSGLCAAGCSDGSIRLWTVPEFEQRRSFEIGSPVVSLAFSPDGRRIAACAAGRLSVWDVASRRRIAARQEEDGPHRAIFSPDGRMILAPAANEVRVYDSRGLAGVALLQGHTARVLSSAVSPGGRMAVAGGEDRTLCAWSVEDLGTPR